MMEMYRNLKIVIKLVILVPTTVTSAKMKMIMTIIMKIIITTIIIITDRTITTIMMMMIIIFYVKFFWRQNFWFIFFSFPTNLNSFRCYVFRSFQMTSSPENKQNKAELSTVLDSLNRLAELENRISNLEQVRYH